MSLTKFEKDPTEKGLFDKIQEIIETILNFATVAKTGSYNDLTDKPTVPGEQIQSDWNQTTTTAKDYIKNKPTIPDAQVNSDWNAVSGKAQILNKPTLFSGSYNDLTNKPTIPAAQIQSDWGQTITTALDYIKNKPTLFSGNYNDLTNKPTIPSAVTESTVSDWGFTKNAGTVTKVNGISPVSGNVTLNIPAAQIQADWNQTTASALDYIKNKPTLFSGSYNDLTNKPTIPSAVTESTVNGWGFTKNAGTVTSVNNTAPVNGNVTLTIPSAVTESTVSGWGFTKFNGSYTSLTNVPSSFTPSAHNQASSTINALTSYSKSVSGGTGALSTSDTLNKALAKLENALDGKQASGNYLTGITSSMVTAALGYTPYSSANPNGYTSNIGTITGITMNGVSKGTSGVVDLGTVLTSHQSLAGYLQNTATGTNSLTISGTATSATSSVNIGATSTAGGGYSVALGYYAASNGARSTSIGYGARIGASTADAIQIGNGTNSTAKSLSIGFYNTANYILLDGTTGLIPDARISSNIARTSQIPSAVTESTVSGWGFTKNAGTVTSVNNTAPVNGNVTLTIPDTSNFVSKSGDTMTGDLLLSNCTATIITPATKGTNPNEDIWRGIAFNDNTNSDTYSDTRLGNIEHCLSTNGSSHTYLRAYKNDKTVTTNAFLELTVDSSGNTSCLVNVTPANNDNSKKIATTEFVKTAALGNYVNVNSSIISSSTSLKGSSNLSYTLSLPNDGRKYLCLIWAELQVTATSGHNANIKVGSDICSIHSICKGVTRSNATFTASGATWVPVSSTHKLYVGRASDWEANMTALVFGGYMRMGENS